MTEFTVSTTLTKEKFDEIWQNFEREFFPWKLWAKQQPRLDIQVHFSEYVADDLIYVANPQGFNPPLGPPSATHMIITTEIAWRKMRDHLSSFITSEAELKQFIVWKTVSERIW